MNHPNDSADAGRADEALSRRDALARGVGMLAGGAGALGIAAVPLALAALARPLSAQAPVTIRGVLEFAYLLENLESEFYKAVLGDSATAAQNAAFAPVRAQLGSDPKLLAALEQIAKHEAAHVAFLKAQITALGGAPITYTGAEFDFTGGNTAAFTGPFALAKSDPGVLLALAQVLEDTGVRAYKGQLDKLMSDKDILTAAVRIHSVEARHAARIRLLRNVTGLKPWITSTATSTTTGISGLSSAGSAIVTRAYTRETNAVQQCVDMTGLGTNTGGTGGVTEAFDEPLTYDDVIFVIQNFVIGTTP